MKAGGKQFYIALVILIIGGFFVFRAPHGKSMPLKQPIFTFEDQIGEWKGETPRTLDPKVMEVLRVNNYVDRIYRNAQGEWISLYVGYFADQKSGQTIHSPKNCLPGSGWNFETSQTVSFEIESSEYPPIPFKALRGILVNKKERMLAYYWFQSRGHFMASEYWHKFYLITDAIRYNRTDGSLVRVLAPLSENSDIDAIDAELRAFITDFTPILQYEYFPEPVGS
jgi:EpsI family protein